MALTKEKEIESLRTELDKYKTKDTAKSVPYDIIIGTPFEQGQFIQSINIPPGNVMYSPKYLLEKVLRDDDFDNLSESTEDTFCQDGPPDLQALVDNGFTVPAVSDISQIQKDVTELQNLADNTSQLDTPTMEEKLMTDFQTWCTENEFEIYKDSNNNSYVLTPLSFDEISAQMSGVHTHLEFLWRLSELLFDSYKWNIYSVSDNENIFCWYNFERDFLDMADN